MMSLELRGVRVHNLKGVDVAFPLGRLTLVAGVSGSGKSSLIFDTLHAESQRRYLQSFSVASRQLLERFDQPDADSIGDLPPAIAVRSTDSWSRSAFAVGDVTDLSELFADLFAREGVAICPSCGIEVRPHSVATTIAELQSLPAGTRVTLGFPDRPGEGESVPQWAERLREEGWVRLQIGAQIHRLDEKSLPADIADGLVLIDRVEIGKASDQRLFETIETGFRRGDGRIVALSESGEKRFDRRWRCPRCQVAVATPEPRLFDARDPLGACAACGGAGAIKGIRCAACAGCRFSENARSVRWQGQSIVDVNERTLAELAPRFPSSSQLGGCLAALLALDLGHLMPGRLLEELATGEAQRLRLHRAIASDLTGALYLFDEPTTGLHPHDVETILPLLLRLRDAGNTVVVVDHHPRLLSVADHHIELGPGAGDEGGTITYYGPPVEVEPPPFDLHPRQRTHGEISLTVAASPPLNDIQVAFPLGVLCVIAGVSGAGKTRLLRDTLFPAALHAKHKLAASLPGVTLVGANQFEDVYLFDQTPLSRSARSNAATVLKIFDEIREVYAATTDAKIRNFDAGVFSFNQPGGRCETCEGQGRLAVDMQFLPDVMATCPECLGRRYRKEVLGIKVRGLNIAEALDLTAREAFRFFRTQRALEKKLKWLLDVGLDYVRLGQPLETYSLGESQRLKLASHLASNRKPRSLFLMIEPTRGLHADDAAGLLECFGQLLGTGHSLVIEDQNPVVLRAADYLIELGPRAGGGKILATGTPAEIANLDTPTGRFLRGAAAIVAGG
ncbi:MAG: hypothetical protein WCL32_10475 [Planctomycetota bacterium]